MRNGLNSNCHPVFFIVIPAQAGISLRINPNEINLFMNLPTFHTFQNQNEWITAVIQETIKNIPANSPFSFAFSGGTTPIPIYQKLSQEKLPWENSMIFQVDERFIGPENPESNQKLIQDNFVQYFPHFPGKIHYFDTPDKSTWEESALKYDHLLKELDPQIDVCFLGVGEDGHIASLFPNGPEILETEKYATTSETNIYPVWKRLTMTFPIILRSKKIVLLLRGNGKREVLEELQNGTKFWEESPVKKLLEHKNCHVFFLSS